ncbi:hypothetical protein [Mesorhizobium sp.]|uniref:hypothetical protein n=1 Tax=Mesorhizobium sp. TaxID=1871066 RepID=UPI0025849BA2|nr:hypothetical protein [Mesorhizobium sp.]
MFATDEAIAEALVGKLSAQKWVRERLPILTQKPGFPAIDAFHGGRPVPRFYETYLGLANHSGKPDGKEDASAWIRSKKR